MSNESAVVSQYRVLIVEDDVNIARLLAACLQPLKFDLKFAATGTAALAAFEATQPHLILLDIMLPEMDGREVLTRIRQTSTVPIIMMSARHEEADQLGGFKLGADDYITKPFNPHLLVARVVAQLRRVYKYDVPTTETTAATTPPASAPAAPATSGDAHEMQKKRDMEAATRAAGGSLVDDTPRSLPAGWAQCDNCNYMGPRQKFESEDAVGRRITSCPSCKLTEGVVFSIDLGG